MCGIAGVINKKKTVNVGEQMGLMLQGLKHRGPDSTGYAMYGTPLKKGFVMRFKISENEAEKVNATHWLMMESRSLGPEQPTDINVDNQAKLDPLILGSATELSTYQKISEFAKKANMKIRVVAYEYLPRDIFHDKGKVAIEGLELLKAQGTEDFKVEVYGIKIPGLEQYSMGHD